MHVNLPTNGNVTGLSSSYNEQNDENFFNETIKYKKKQKPTFFPVVSTTKSSKFTFPIVWTLRTVPKRDSSYTIRFTTIQESLPPVTTELPESTTDRNIFYNGILGGVIVVIVAWIGVATIFLRNKVQTRRQRRRERLSPSSSNVPSNSAFDFSEIVTDPQFGLSEQSQSSIVEIETTAEYSSLYTIQQPSAPPLAATSHSSTNGLPPPRYEDIQHRNRIPLHYEEQPPSYLESQQQRIKLSNHSDNT